MNLRKIILCGLAAGALSSVSLLQAQDEKGKGRGQGGGGRGSPEAQVTRIDEAVTLTADQKTKVTAIFTKLQEQMQAIPQEERREKGMALREAAQKEVRALLTPEQQAKFDAMPQGRGQGRGEGGGKKGN